MKDLIKLILIIYHLDHIIVINSLRALRRLESATTATSRLDTRYEILEGRHGRLGAPHLLSLVNLL